MKFFKVASFLLSLSTVALAQDFCNNASHSGEKLELASDSPNRKGRHGNFDYEVWADGGNNSATFYTDGSFSCKFSNTKDYLCRTGVQFSSPRYPSEIGKIKAEYKVVKQNAQNVGYSYVGVYGWTLSSGINGVFEFYIVDNWLSQFRPGDWVGNEKKGDFTIDGGQYTVYKNVNGNLTQYFSLRTSPRTCGTIDVTAHFDQWEKIGMKMGKITEVKVLGEAGNTGGGCSGTVDFPYAKIYINGDLANTGVNSDNDSSGNSEGVFSFGNFGGNGGGNTGGGNGGGFNFGGNGGGNTGGGFNFGGNGGGNTGGGFNFGGNGGGNGGGFNFGGNGGGNTGGFNFGGNTGGGNTAPPSNGGGNTAPPSNGGGNSSSNRCSAKIVQQGYKCCKSGCSVQYVDSDGYWGVENDQWCGCGNEAPKCVGKQGYPCCKSTKDVVYRDADGNWGVESDDWCYIG